MIEVMFFSFLFCIFAVILAFGIVYADLETTFTELFWSPGHWILMENSFRKSANDGTYVTVKVRCWRRAWDKESAVVFREASKSLKEGGWR